MVKETHEQIDHGFDLYRARQCADYYSSSVGIPCIIIDSNGQTLYGTQPSQGVCVYCQKSQCLLNDLQTCNQVYLYGSYQAERFGGKYVFFCPIGLVHWASPFTKDGMMRGSIIGGPVQMMAPDEFLIEDILRNTKDESCIRELRQYIDQVPIVKPEVVNSMSELLFIVAAHISDVQPSKYLEERENQEQQADISEYIRLIKTMGGDINDKQSYPIEKERELLSLIARGDKAGSQKVLNEIFGHIFFSTGGNFEAIKARVLELVVLLSRAALEGGADVEQIFGLNYKYLSQIHGFTSVEDLTVWLSKIMARFTDCVFNLTNVKHVDVIYRAVDYIKRNYMKKITLEDVATHVYLSASYFSKIFKEEMTYSFNAYLNNLRIEMSKKLLLDDSINLVDVSNLVGYEDQSYFSKVFKKVTGVSPGRYRESRGQQKGDRY